jgi:hypothetical protein
MWKRERHNDESGGGSCERAAPGRDFSAGDIVATAMGGMGRDFDGGYAEYALCRPRKCGE